MKSLNSFHRMYIKHMFILCHCGGMENDTIGSCSQFIFTPTTWDNIMLYTPQGNADNSQRLSPFHHIVLFFELFVVYDWLLLISENDVRHKGIQIGLNNKRWNLIYTDVSLTLKHPVCTRACVCLLFLLGLFCAYENEYLPSCRCDSNGWYGSSNSIVLY